MAPKTVVLCSYGPRKSTHASLRRLRAMLDGDDQVLVYAGTRAGVADAGKVRGIELVEEVGRAGLIAALERATGEFAVHLTDGVTITAGGLQRLFAAAERSGKLVTPWTNDIGTDHHVGALPVHGNTVQVLTALGRQQPERAVRVLRPICVGGRIDQLIALVPHNLGYPTTIMRLVHDDCIAVEGVVAAHDGSAETRMLPPVGPEGRPLLVASMIVRDEELLLEDCLASLAGVVDRVDLCDTGSVDRTVEIARAHGCNVIEREWRDDFGWARNEILAESSDAWWVLWIDADERLVVDDPERIRRELATTVDHFDMLSVAIGADEEKVRQGLDDSGRWITPRLLRPDRMHYEGALHEQIVPRQKGDAVWSTTLDGFDLVHLGYTAELIDTRDKKARNLAIARTQYEADPDDAVHALQYARSLWLAGRPPEDRVELLEQAVDGFASSSDQQVAFVNGLLAQTLVEMRRDEDAVEHAQAALDRVAGDDVAFTALRRAAVRLGRPELVLERLDAYAHGPSLKPVMEDPSGRASNRAEAIRLLREAGQTDLAMQHTAELMAESHREFPHWELVFDGLLESRTPDEFVAEVRDVLTQAREGSWARPLATRVRRDLTLALILEYLDNGRPGADPVRVGLTLAMLMGDDASLDRLIDDHADRLPDADRKAMASRLRERGQTDAADRLSPAPAADEPAYFTFAPGGVTQVAPPPGTGR